jgi:hypothetical protein
MPVTISNRAGTIWTYDASHITPPEFVYALLWLSVYNLNRVRVEVVSELHYKTCCIHVNTHLIPDVVAIVASYLPTLTPVETLFGYNYDALYAYCKQRLNERVSSRVLIDHIYSGAPLPLPMPLRCSIL